MADINALLAQGVGPAILEGAHTNYFLERAKLERAQQQRITEGDQNIPAAMAGSKEALGQVAAKNPHAAVAVTTALSHYDDAARKKHLDAIDWSGRAADVMLKTAPQDRPAVWRQLYQQGTSLGHDMSQTPPEWDNSMEPYMRTVRGMAPDYVKTQRAIELKKTSSKTGGGGGAMFRPPSWGGPATPVPVESGAPGPQSSAAPAGPGNVQTAAYVPPAPTAGQFTPPDANMNVAPPSVPPQEEPDVIRPGLPPPPQVQQAGTPPPPPGHIAMGYKGNPAVINGQPVFHNPETGAWQLGAEPDRAALSSGATADQVPGGGLPGPQMAQAVPPNRAAPTPSAPNVVVHAPPPGYEPYYLDNGQIFINKQGLIPLRSQHGRDLLLKPADEKSTTPPGYEQDPEKPGALRAITGGPADLTRKAGATIPADLRQLHGEDFKATPFFQSHPNQNNVLGLLSGRLKPSDLTGRSQDKNQMIEMAQQIDDSYTPSDADALRRFRTVYMGGEGTGGKTVIAANTAIDHMKTFHDLMNVVANGQMIVPNQVTNYIKTQFGIPDVTNAQAARTILGTEIAKVVKGGQPLNEAEQKAANDVLNPNSSPEQTQGALNTLTAMMMGRVHNLQDFARTKGITEKEAQGYIFPRSQESLEYMQNNPIGGKPRGGDENIPMMTPEQVRAAPSGTRYRTNDGRMGTRP